MSPHLVILDAQNLLRRIHSVQKDPNDINALAKQCEQMLQTTLRHTTPSHALAVFANSQLNECWRKKLLPNYLQNRPPVAPSLTQAFELVEKNFSQQLFVHTPAVLHSEDFIATLITKACAAGSKVTLLSSDQRFCQLLNLPNFAIRDYFASRWLNTEFVQQKFTLSCEKLTDFWGLAGIARRNVPGIAGIGSQSAQLLLQQFDSLESIFAQMVRLENKWQKKLSGQQELACICKQVVTLKTDLPLGINFSQLRLTG
ncbi:MAG: flap endonuclease Xni [Vibrionaceae bacterium]